MAGCGQCLFNLGRVHLDSGPFGDPSDRDWIRHKLLVAHRKRARLASPADVAKQRLLFRIADERRNAGTRPIGLVGPRHGSSARLRGIQRRTDIRAFPRPAACKVSAMIGRVKESASYRVVVRPDKALEMTERDGASWLRHPGIG
jgi:hypothetical protein